MDAKALRHTTQQLPRPIHLVLVRANGPLFYSVAAASLLETLAPVYTQRMRHFFRADPLLSEWMENEWLPRKAARARLLREYVERTWPELDWACAYEQCRAALVSDGGMGPHKPTAAHEAIACCVAAAQGGVVYRSLARWAEDSKLREMAASIAQQDAQSFGHFRAAFERRARLQRFGIVSAWRAAAACMRTGRDLHLALAFGAIKAQCGQHVPFPDLDYSDFVRRMRAVIERHGRLGRAERVVFRPWRGRPRIATTAALQSRPAASFKPVLQAAA